MTAEGNTIRVTYSAGPGKGFVIENQEVRYVIQYNITAKPS